VADALPDFEKAPPRLDENVEVIEIIKKKRENILIIMYVLLLLLLLLLLLFKTIL